MNKFQFKCLNCGCERLNAVHENVEVHDRVIDIRISHESVEYRTVDRMISCKEPSRYVCEACKGVYATDRKGLFKEIQSPHRAWLIPEEEPGLSYMAAARLLRAKVLEMYDDAVDRGCETEIEDLGNALKVASDAGINDYSGQVRTGRYTSKDTNIEEI